MGASRRCLHQPPSACQPRALSLVSSSVMTRTLFAPWDGSAEAGAGAMLVACRLAGLSALEGALCGRRRSRANARPSHGHARPGESTATSFCGFLPNMATKLEEPITLVLDRHYLAVIGKIATLWASFELALKSLAGGLWGQTEFPVWPSPARQPRAAMMRGRERVCVECSSAPTRRWRGRPRRRGPGLQGSRRFASSTRRRPLWQSLRLVRWRPAPSRLRYLSYN